MVSCGSVSLHKWSKNKHQNDPLDRLDRMNNEELWPGPGPHSLYYTSHHIILQGKACAKMLIKENKK